MIYKLYWNVYHLKGDFMKTSIVTGGAGFIGSHLVDRLIEKNHKVVIVDNLSTGSKKNLNPKAKFYKLDIQSSRIKEVFKKEKPDTLFHFAAQIDVRKSVDNPKEDANINILGSLNLFENCRKFGVKKAIFASTGGAIYGEAGTVPTPERYPAHPVSPYGIAKLSIEHYLYYYYKAHNLPFVALRFSNVYGPRQNSKGEAGVVAIFSDAMLSDRQPVIYGSGKQTRDYLFVRDAVDSTIMALQENKVGVFNVGTGKETSVNELFKMLCGLTHSSAKSVRRPSRKGEQQRSSLDSSKIRKKLGWKYRYDIKKGLKETVSWLEQI